MNYIFSIGLNVGDDEPASQFAATLEALESLKVLNFEVFEGEWHGVSERTMQVRAECFKDDGAVCLSPIKEAQRLARILNQDAVAYTIDGDVPSEGWGLVDREGVLTKGGSVVEFPVKV